ncbi:MAG: type III secretion system chaperone [Verrucomicrobiales bacterium]|nr:type III secretion system chaperone [Verrucomicrobiales bacterium]
MDDQTQLDLQGIIIDVARRGEIAEVRFYEPNLWVFLPDEDFALGLELGEEFALELELDEISGSFMLSCRLSEAPQDDERDTYKLLLQLNTLWRETGGLSMGLDGTDGKVIQMFTFPANAINAEGLYARLINFLQVASRWKKIVRTRPPLEEVNLLENLNFIRV